MSCTMQWPPIEFTKKAGVLKLILSREGGYRYRTFLHRDIDYYRNIVHLYLSLCQSMNNEAQKLLLKFVNHYAEMWFSMFMVSFT
jgi:hypothetical protein